MIRALANDYVVVTGPPHKAGEYIPGWSNAVFEATSATIAGLSRDTTEPTVPNDYDFLFTVSNSVGVVSTNVTVRVPSVASALGFDSTEVTADEIVCQVKSFGISENGGKQNGEKSGAAITFFVTVMFLD